jgi:MraZ protein
MCNSLKVDEKGRLKIPMTFLSKLEAFGTEFYITSEKGDSVRIYPMKVWNQVEEQLEHQSLHSTSDRNLLARVKYFGQTVTIDKQNRVLIPIVLRNSARMKGPVDVLDYVTYLEVWNHARLMKNLQSNPVTAEAETTLNKMITTRRSPLPVDRKNKSGHAQGRERRFVVHRRLHGNSHGQLSHATRGGRTDATEHARVA